MLASAPEFVTWGTELPMSGPLGEFLEKERARYGWSVRDLASRAGVAHTTIRNSESGLHHQRLTSYRPRPGTLRDIARALAMEDPLREQQLYREMMVLAGYEPPESEQPHATSVPLRTLRIFQKFGVSQATATKVWQARTIEEASTLERVLEELAEDIDLDQADED